MSGILIKSPVDEGPRGYPHLSAFVASDQNMMLFRGFANIHTRLLLNLQTEIQYFENELDDFDKLHEDKNKPAPHLRLQSWNFDVS